MNNYESKLNYDSPCDSDNDWTNSTGGSKYSDSESSVPEWDSDVAEDGELVYIKTVSVNENIDNSKTPLLENCETFKLRNNFKRSSTRKSTKGVNLCILLHSVRFLKVLWHITAPKALKSIQELNLVREMAFNMYKKYKSYKTLPEYTLLSGAGRKRFWNLVKEQMPPKEALVVASRGKIEKLLELENSGQKRHIQNYHQSATPKKIQKTKKKETQDQANNAPNPVNAQTQKKSKSSELENQDKPKSKLVSLVEIHNTQLMSDEEINMVHEALLLEIAKGEAGKGPRFCGFFNKKGFILVLCENHDSQEWLVKTVEKIKPWPEAKLSIKLKNRTLNASTFLPGQEADTVEKALKLLQIQNKGLNTGEWIVLSEREFQGGKVVTFSIDRYSFEALKVSKFKALLGFRNIFLKITNPQSEEVSQPDKVVERAFTEESSAESEINSEVKQEVNLNNGSSVKEQVQEPNQDEIKPAEPEDKNQEQQNQEMQLPEPCWDEEL